jgi:hypothetical protein
VNATLAVTAARRQLTRTQSRIATETLALSAPVQDSRTVPQDNPRTVPVLSPDSGQDSPQDRTGTVQDTGQDRTALPRTVRDTPADLSGRLSQRAFVRGLLSADPSLSNEELSASIRAEYGADTKTESIRKAIQRARGDLSQAV